MRLTDILKPQNIKIPLTAGNKTDAITELVQLLAGNGDVGDPKKVLDSVLEREATRTTGIGNGHDHLAALQPAGQDRPAHSRAGANQPADDDRQVPPGAQRRHQRRADVPDYSAAGRSTLILRSEPNFVYRLTRHAAATM